jgi:hypothetical protein
VCAQDGVISKPFRISELIPKIEELVLKYVMLPKAEVDSAEGD